MPLSDILKGVRLLWAWWVWFWFRPIQAGGTGVMRVLIGVMMVMTTIDIFPDLAILVGPDGIYSETSASRGLRLARWTYFDHISTMNGVYVVHGIALVANVLFMLGYKSRTMGLLSVIAHAALYQRNSWFMNGGDRLVREMAFYLCLVPCGAKHSIDAWLDQRRRHRRGQRPRKSPTVPIVAMRLIQIQLAFMYVLSGIEKWGSGSWQRGSAVYYSLSTDNYSRSDWLVSPLLDTRIGYDITQIGTIVTLYWECWFWALVLWRPTRWVALVIGVLLHGGIHLGLMVAFFSFASMWGYLAFLPYDWVERLGQGWRLRQSGS